MVGRAQPQAYLMSGCIVTFRCVLGKLNGLCHLNWQCKVPYNLLTSRCVIIVFLLPPPPLEPPKGRTRKESIQGYLVTDDLSVGDSGDREVGY